jgi:hypothetical protein
VILCVIVTRREVGEDGMMMMMMMMGWGLELELELGGCLVLVGFEI